MIIKIISEVTSVCEKKLNDVLGMCETLLYNLLGKQKILNEFYASSWQQSAGSSDFHSSNNVSRNHGRLKKTNKQRYYITARAREFCSGEIKC